MQNCCEQLGGKIRNLCFALNQWRFADFQKEYIRFEVGDTGKKTRVKYHCEILVNYVEIVRANNFAISIIL